METPRRVRASGFNRGLVLAILVAAAIIVLVIMLPVVRSYEDTILEGRTPDGAKASRPGVMTVFVVSLLLIPVGFVLLCGTVIFYWLAVRTRCFTWAYDRPVFRRYRAKRAVINFLVYAGLVYGLTSLAAPLVEPIRAATALSRIPIYLGIAFTVYLVIRIFRIWAPTEEPLVFRRLQAAGVPDGELDRGRCVIVRPPDQIWDRPVDIGMLWFLEDRMVYRGDRDGFEVQAVNYFSVERENGFADFDALWGAVPPILHFWDGTGTKRLRLDPCGVASIWRLARACDELDETIRTWGEAALRRVEEEYNEEPPQENAEREETDSHG